MPWETFQGIKKTDVMSKMEYFTENSHIATKRDDFPGLFSGVDTSTEKRGAREIISMQHGLKGHEFKDLNPPLGRTGIGK